MVAVGTPTWWYTMAPPVKTFFSQNDLAEKTVIAFMTNAGWSGHVIDDMQDACPGATHGPSMEVRFGSGGGSSLKTSEREMDAWTKRVVELL